MNDLDNPSLFKSLDKGHALNSIVLLPAQCRQAWEESQSLSIPQSFRDVNNIVISGMGGSTYGARIVKSLYDGAQMARVPVELANNYWLPGYVNEKSLVILSSYSGSTEETLASAKQAKERQAKIIGITSGGALGKFLKDNHYPSYIFNPLNNPSNQPRIGAGYMVIGLIGLLAKMNIIPVGNKEIEKLTAYMKEKNEKLIPRTPTGQNPAKSAALKIYGKLPVIIVADFLEGAAYSIRNPFHETAKQFGLYFTIPELNHHLMEGLSYPKELKKYFIFIFIKSDIYDKRNIMRMELTKEVVEKNGIKSEQIKLGGYSTLTQAMETVQFFAFVTFYLAMLNNVDPSKIPWVDYFKRKLKI